LVTAGLGFKLGLDLVSGF